MAISDKDRNTLFAVLSANGIKEDGRRAIIASFTNQRTESLKDVEPEEVKAMIAHLNGEGKGGQTRRSAPTPLDIQMDTMRKKIISRFRTMGWVLAGGKADMPRIYKWVLKYGAAHKPLNKLNYLDLTDLVTEVEAVYRKHLEGVRI